MATWIAIWRVTFSQGYLDWNNGPQIKRGTKIENDKSRRDLINENSVDADLTLIGFHEGMMKSENNSEIFEGYDKIGNILFVNTLTSKSIK